jgi:hypothetical protein
MMRDEDRRAIQRDRLEALRSGGVDAISALFERAPAIAELVQDTGPLAAWRPSSENWTAKRLAAELTRTSSTVALLAHLDRTQQQLIGLAKWMGGALTREHAIAESGLDPEILDNAVAVMAELLLINPAAGWLVLRPGVADMLRLPGVVFRDGAEYITSADLATLCRNLGINPGRLKTERVDAIEAAIRDPDIVLQTLRALGPEAETAFNRIGAEEAFDLDHLWDDLNRSRDDHDRYAERKQTVIELHSLGLVGLNLYEHRAWVWLDVQVALRGRLFDTWDRVELDFVPAPGDTDVRIPAIVGMAERVLAQLSSTPQPALKSGGIGTNAVKAVAKAVGLPTPTTGLVVILLIELQLLGTVVTEATGRGRNRNVVEEWRPIRSDEWRTSAPVDQWLWLVSTWAQSVRLPLTETPLQRHDLKDAGGHPPLARGLLLRALRHIPESVAVDRKQFGHWVAFKYPTMCTPGIANQLVDQAQILGLLDGTDLIVPTPLARHWLAGDDLRAVVAAGSRGFVVQADHTIIAPPDLSHEVTVRLHQIATLESDHGAHVYRIDDHTLTPAFDAEYDADDILAFLADHSTVGIPEVVDRTIRDASARHGRLRVGSTTTWIACDDPVMLSNAVAVNRAGLTAVSPTAAVSELPRNKVVAALRAAGIAAVDETVNNEQQQPRSPVRIWGARTGYPIIDPNIDAHRLAAALQDGTVEPAAPPPDPRQWWRDAQWDEDFDADLLDSI